MNENKEFFIRYRTNQLVKIETHYIGENGRNRPLKDVADLVAAFQARPGSLLGNTDSGLITLHLPDGVARSTLQEDCFAATDSTSLDSGCSLGSKSKDHVKLYYRKHAFLNMHS